MTASTPETPRPKTPNVVPMTARPAQPLPVERKASPPGHDDSHPADEPGYGHGV